MSQFRRRLLIMQAMNNGLPNSPIRFSDGSIARFSDDKRGYFALDRKFVRDKTGRKMYFKDGKRMGVLREDKS